MKKNYRFHSVCCAALLFSGCADDSLRSASLVADRLLVDTAFELCEQPAKSAPFPVVFADDAVSDGGAHVCMVNVPADSVYRMGVNSVDRAEIRVDGRRIVTVAGCGRAFPREVAYDTYLFNDYVSLKLTRGEHRVDILSTGKISFGLVDSLDFQVRNVSYIVIEHENKAKEFRIPIKK